MSRPPAALALAAALAALAAACDRDEGQTCPGDPVATFEFGGPRVFLGDAALAGVDPVPSFADCAEPIPYPPELTPFEATLADAGPQTAALCKSSEIVLFGNRTATGFFVETRTSGAVLDGCSPDCSAELRLVVTGDVSGGGADPFAFQGLVVEVLTHVAGDCGACLPLVPAGDPGDPEVHGCAARYAVTGTP